MAPKPKAGAVAAELALITGAAGWEGEIGEYSAPYLHAVKP